MRPLTDLLFLSLPNSIRRYQLSARVDQFLKKKKFLGKSLEVGHKCIYLYSYLRACQKLWLAQPYICDNQMTELHVISVGILVSGEKSSVPYVKPCFSGFFKNDSSSAAVHDKERWKNVQWEIKANREKWNWGERWNDTHFSCSKIYLCILLFSNKSI